MVLRQPSGAGAPAQRAYKRKGSMSDESVPEARPASDEPVALARPEQDEGGPAPSGGGDVVRKRRRRGSRRRSQSPPSLINQSLDL